ncbi:hypothetical protein [Actinomadura chokoriensis]|uniref:hypothetical protein n=1 Tax=Actinomadura chokoriensis TaxID=454156 RepID=UPI0031F79EE7
MIRRDTTRPPGSRAAATAVAAGAGMPATAQAAVEAGHAPQAPVRLTVGDRARPLTMEGAPLFGWTPRDRDPGKVRTAYGIAVRGASGGQEYGNCAGPFPGRVWEYFEQSDDTSLITNPEGGFGRLALRSDHR